MNEEIKVGDFIEVTTPGGGKFPAIAAYSSMFDIERDINIIQTIQPFNKPFNSIYPLTLFVDEYGIVSPHMYYSATGAGPYQINKQLNYYQGQKKEEGILVTEDGFKLNKNSGDEVWYILENGKGMGPCRASVQNQAWKGCLVFKEKFAAEKEYVRRKVVFSGKDIEELVLLYNKNSSLGIAFQFIHLMYTRIERIIKEEK